jgi:hypothetical protein
MYQHFTEVLQDALMMALEEALWLMRTGYGVVRLLQGR